MAISYVGGVQGGRAGATTTTTQSLSGTLTGGSNTSPSAGDLVVVFCATGSDGTGAPTSQDISGNNNGAYTGLTFQSTSATTYDSGSEVSYKIQGGTVDTTVTIPSSGNARNAQRWVVHVFRGVDATTPLDVTSTYATGTATGRPNPALIAPTTAGAWICAFYASAAATGTAYTAPTDFATDWLGGTTADNADCMTGGGYYTGWTSGNYDPAAITAGGTTNAADSWTATTIALRPAPPDPLSVNESESVIVSDSTSSVATYYFDGSDAAATDPNSVWTNDANAFDGSTATNASVTTTGSVSTNYLMAEGTDAPGSGGAISQVRARIYGSKTGAGAGVNAAIYTNGLSELLGTPIVAATTGSAAYGSYTTLSTPSGGWDWAKVQALEIKIYGSTGVAFTSGEAFRVEVEVTSGDASSFVNVSIDAGSSDPTISKSDTATLTESVTINIDPKLVVETETATLTESVTVRQENYVINKSDSISVTDTDTVTLGALPDYTISVSDSTTITDTDNVIQGNYTVNKSESATVTDTPTVSQGNYIISKSETATLTESRTVLIPELPISKSDTATVTDTPTVLIAERTVNVSDSTTVTDVDTVTITAIDDLAATVSDTSTLTENLTILIPELLINKSDSVAVTESVSIYQTNYNINKSETVTGTESTTLLIPELFVNETENVSTTENAIVNTGNQAFYNVITSESATVSEQVTAVMSDGLQSVSDNVTLTESVAVSVQATTTPNIAKSESISVGESVTVEPPLLVIGESESVNVYDTPTVSLPTLETNIVVSDSISGSTTPARKYYIDSEGSVYWIVSEAIGLVQKV